MIIREDRRNYRKHSEQNLKLIGRSLDNYGAGRSIVADNSGSVIGGNGTLREANKRGLKQRIVHTTGDELVVVVRDDIAPDFSVYNDMPTCMQLWQHFKSRMFAYMCYQAGLNVIPNLIFSDTRTFSKRNGFVFDGIESGGTVCLSTSGCRRNPEYQKGIIEGMKAFLDVCEPQTIIVYGDAPNIDFGSIEIVEFKPFGFGKQFISERKQKECKK